MQPTEHLILDTIATTIADVLADLDEAIEAGNWCDVRKVSLGLQRLGLAVNMQAENVRRVSQIKPHNLHKRNQ